MDQIIHFMMQHPYLWGALLLVIGLLVLLEFEASLQGIRRLGASDVSLMMNRKGVVVDVNEPDDFAKGHILGAIHVPFSKCAQSVSSVKSHKADTIIVVANQERSSLQAAKMLKQQGFKEIAILSGGLVAWREANLPLVRK